MKKYLIVKCKELNDQWECEADRKPVCVTDNYSRYNRYGFDIWLIKESGSLVKIKDYTDKSVR